MSVIIILRTYMSDDYNSKLLARLYNPRNEKELTNTVEEMTRIGSEIFLYPLLDVYKKNQNTFITHYFIIAISAIKSDSAKNLLITLFKDPNTKDLDKMEIISYYEKIEYYDTESIKYSKDKILHITQLPNPEFEDGMNLTAILYYLSKGKRIDIEIQKTLQEVIFNKETDPDITPTSIRYWLKSDTNNFDYLIEKYLISRNDDLDIMLSEELLKWQGTKVEKLKKLIKENGYIRAKEIILKAEENKHSKDTEKESIVYSNSGLVAEIRELRKKINFMSIGLVVIKAELFNQNEALIEQQEVATGLEHLGKKCIELREIIQDFSSITKTHGMTLTEAQKILPGIKDEDINKSLNSTHLFLVSKGIPVTCNFFGLKRLNQLLSLVGAHSGDVSDLVTILKSYNLYELYKENKFELLHKSILEEYKKSLLLMEKAFSENTS